MSINAIFMFINGKFDVHYYVKSVLFLTVKLKKKGMKKKIKVLHVVKKK